MAKELTVEKRKELIAKYPYLMPRTMFTDEVHPDFNYEFIKGEHDLPKGWLELFLQCCEDLYEPLKRADYLNKFRFLDIKEKWGAMDFSTYRITSEVSEILEKYRFISKQVCSRCGKPATVRTYSYVLPFCLEHIKGSGETIEDVELITPQTSYIRTEWVADCKREKSISVKDEWERYLKRIGYTDDSN